MNCVKCGNYSDQDRCHPDCDPDLLREGTKNEDEEPRYSVDYAIHRDKPHWMKEYILARREWEKLPFNPNEDLEELADRLEALLPEKMRTNDGRDTTLLVLEVAQEEKEKEACA